MAPPFFPACAREARASQCQALDVTRKSHDADSHVSGVFPRHPQETSMSDQSVKMGKSETNFVRNSVFFFLLFCSFFLSGKQSIKARHGIDCSPF
jgi:hypothetical protein